MPGVTNILAEASGQPHQQPWKSLTEMCEI